MSKDRYVGRNYANEPVHELSNGLRFVRRGDETVFENVMRSPGRRPHDFLRAGPLSDNVAALIWTLRADPHFTSDSLKRLYTAVFGTERAAYSLAEFVTAAEEGLGDEADTDIRVRLLRAAQPAPDRMVENSPILLVGINGVVRTLQSKIFRRQLDVDAMGYVSRLGRALDAKLVALTPNGLQAKAAYGTLSAHGWPADLWHSQMPMISADWPSIDNWLSERDVDALIIAPEGDRHPGPLGDRVGDFYVDRHVGFTMWDYFFILQQLGVPDPDGVPPPERTGGGFGVAPNWRKKGNSASKPEPVRHSGSALEG